MEFVEDTEHIFSICPHNLDVYNKATLEILEVINKVILPTHINTFPFWFTNSLLAHVSLNEFEDKLISFPKSLRDIGYILIALKDWILSLKLGKSGKRLLENIIFIFQSSVYRKWLDRCDRMFQNKFPHTV